MQYVVKGPIGNANDNLFAFRAHKTMYSGKAIRAKDEVFIFSSENEGGEGLIACGIVTSLTRRHIKRKPEVELYIEFYRQGTNKVAAFSEDTASFSRALF